MPRLITSDARGNLKTVDAGFSDAYYSSAADAGFRLDVAAGLNAARAYQLVSWLYRGVNMVASAISNFPFALANDDGDDLQEEPEYASIMADFRQNLFMVAGSLYLTGAAYLWPDTNARGTNITLRFVRSKFMTPIVKAGRLVGFRYSDHDDPTIPREVPLDKIIYFWNPNFDSAVAPGPAEAAVALGAASLLYAMTSMEAAFFNGGGIPVTFIETPGQMSDPDKDKFQNFFNRAVSGVRNAFRYLVVRTGIKATVLGSHIKDTQAPELTATERDSVAVALGVPPSLLSGKVSDVMNSRADKFLFYDVTIIPLFGRIVEVFNEQLFSKFQVPVKLMPAEDELEVMQSSQLEQAQAVSEIVGKPVMTIDEGRDWLGLEKATPEQRRELGIDKPEPATPPAVVPVVGPAGQAQPASAQFNEMVAAQAKALAEWRRGALDAVKAGGSALVPHSAEIDVEVQTQVVNGLAEAHTPADVRAVFERHWPKPRKAAEPADVADLRSLLREAIDAAKVLSAEDSSGAGGRSRPPAPLVVERMADGGLKMIDTEPVIPNITVTAPPPDMTQIADAVRALSEAVKSQPAPVVKIEPAQPSQPAQVTVINKLPRIKRQVSKITRDASDLASGTETTFEYEE